MRHLHRRFLAVRRAPSSKIGLIALGLLMWSVAIREVSEVPGGWVFSIS
jgi:hypothetical protein